MTRRLYGSLPSDDVELPSRSQSEPGAGGAGQEADRSRQLAVRAIILLALALGAFVAFSGASNRSSMLQLSTSESGYTATFSTYNAYTQTKPILLAAALWQHYAEPYRPSTFEAEVTPEPSGDVKYIWRFGSSDGFEQVEGATVTYTFTTVGRHNVQLIVESGSSELATYSADVMVKYVRRNIYDLTDEDRTIFLDTLHLLYEITDEEAAQAQYGPNFRTMARLASLHIANVADPECDHYHDGNGVYNTHSALSWELEQALQSVNPSIALPYYVSSAVPLRRKLIPFVCRFTTSRSFVLLRVDRIMWKTILCSVIIGAMPRFTIQIGWDPMTTRNPTMSLAKVVGTTLEYVLSYCPSIMRAYGTRCSFRLAHTFRSTNTQK